MVEHKALRSVVLPIKYLKPAQVCDRAGNLLHLLSPAYKHTACLQLKWQGTHPLVSPKMRKKPLKYTKDLFITLLCTVAQANMHPCTRRDTSTPQPHLSTTVPAGLSSFAVPCSRQDTSASTSGSSGGCFGPPDAGEPHLMCLPPPEQHSRVSRCLGLAEDTGGSHREHRDSSTNLHLPLPPGWEGPKRSQGR